MLERFGHGGDLRTAAEVFGRSEDAFIDFSSNMNPFGPPDTVRMVLADYSDEIMRYPDPAVRELTAKLAAQYSIPRESVLVGNGAAELIDLIFRVLRPDATAIARPSFGEYEDAVIKIGGRIVDIPLRADRQFTLAEADAEAAMKQADAIILGHPNNPTGRLIPQPIVDLLRAGGKTLIVDEAFIDFEPDETDISLIREAAYDPQLYVIRSMTKFYAIPGIRLGFVVAHPDRVAALREQQVTWSVNSLAQKLGAAVLSDSAYADRTRRWLAEAKPALVSKLEKIGVRVVPGSANFMLLQLPDGISVKDAQRAMGAKGVLIRDASLFAGLDASYCRVAVRTEPENDQLVRALAETLAELGATGVDVQPSANGETHTIVPAATGQTLMLQGTSSDVGKSLLTAALCRIFTQDGIRVVPFKSQNMSLNSYVTPDGKEIGRAQGMQADACRVAATTDMNPILLKPTKEMASQVVLHGKPLADMDARSYRERYLPTAGAIVREALGRLRASYELVVIEGAGSPAEVNLKDRDIVNMRLAGWADAPVLLVADIDRGGVFASLVGTLDILTPDERERVKGFIINKFRGDVSLLTPGIDWLENRTGKPVLGVVPFLPNVGLEDEDSASLAAKLVTQPKRRTGTLDVAVLKLPYISNFTDFDPLWEEPDVTIRYITSAEQFGTPDIVLLPGSKNTIHDLNDLRQKGLDVLIHRHVELGGFLTGICAGYQMMGRSLHDPFGVESEAAEASGLGLFPTETTFASDKRTERVVGVAGEWYGADSAPISGYEIHMGRTRFLEPAVQPFRLRLERFANGGDELHPDGAMSADGRVWGTYVHGILHNDELRRVWLNEARKAKGWPPLDVTVRFGERREAAFDRLAEHVRRHLDMARIYEMIAAKGRGTEERTQ